MNVTRRCLLSGCLLSGSVSALGAGKADGNTTERLRDKASGYDYRKPEFKPESRLVFQGDSITDMKWGRNEKDRNHYLGHSYVYLIASRLGFDMPNARLNFFNRGMSGHRVGDLRKRWQRDAIELKPDLLSVLVGVNDVGRNLDGVNVVQWENDYRFSF